MDFRILTEPQQGATYADLCRVAKSAEEVGFEGFFRSDHYLKMGEVSGLPGPTDAWITLAGLARETSRIRLGTLVSAATFRHPSVLAISAAQVDQMSGGRVEVGLGAGYFEAEHRAYGIPLPVVKDRFDRYAEQLAIVTGLWETPPGGTFNFAGKYYRLHGAPALPKPAQPPHPPVIIGGAGKKRTPTLAARYADEFNVIFRDAATAVDQFERVATAAREAGRDPNEITRSAALVVCVGRNRAEIARRIEAIGCKLPNLVGKEIAGSPNEVAEKIDYYREKTGITRLYLEAVDVFDLDHVELIASTVLPHFK